MGKSITYFCNYFIPTSQGMFSSRVSIHLALQMSDGVNVYPSEQYRLYTKTSTSEKIIGALSLL